MTPDNLAHLRRARDLMDREYATPLDVPALAPAALMSPAHFSRQFRAVYGETPDVMQEPIDQPYGVRDCALPRPFRQHGADRGPDPAPHVISRTP